MVTKVVLNIPESSNVPRRTSISGPQSKITLPAIISRGFLTRFGFYKDLAAGKLFNVVFSGEPMSLNTNHGMTTSTTLGHDPASPSLTSIWRSIVIPSCSTFFT